MLTLDATVAVADLGYRVRSREILRKVSFEVYPGVTGLLGRNGAGKTTLLRCLSTATTPTNGSITVLGKNAVAGADVRDIRRSIGYAPQANVAYRHLTALDHVSYAAWLKGMSFREAKDRAAEALDRVDLSEQAQTRARRLSGGMLRRLCIAMAIVTEPAVILLDEPTAGLDPEQRVRFRRLVRELGSAASVVLSTHLIEDVASVCDRAVVLRRGEVVYRGDIDGLSSASGSAGDPVDATRLEASFLALTADPAERRSPT